jgi:hypothetical protein
MNQDKETKKVWTTPELLSQDLDETAGKSTNISEAGGSTGPS